MLVPQEVVEAVSGSPQPLTWVFAASCAERMAQLYTGLAARADGFQSAQMDSFIETIGRLWDPTTPSGELVRRAEELERFPQFSPRDRGLTDPVDIYSFYALLALRFALRSGGSQGADEAMECSHVALTAVGQLDNSLNDSQLFQLEMDAQRKVALHDGEITQDYISGLRDRSGVIGRERLDALLGRIG